MISLELNSHIETIYLNLYSNPLYHVVKQIIEQIEDLPFLKYDFKNIIKLIWMFVKHSPFSRTCP